MVVALFAGVAIGYFGNTPSQTTVTKTSTLTQGSGLEACTVTQYAVWSIESVHNGTIIGGGTSTESNVVTTFQTTGLPSSTTNTYTGTLTGAISSWTVTNCDFGLQTSTQPTTSATCIQTVSAPLYLIVKNDSGAPIPNQPLSIQAHLLVGFAYNWTTGMCDAILSTHLWTNETGSDGKIELGMTGDVFNITTSYLGRSYQVNTDAEGAESAECVTLSLPSGIVTTTFAGTFKYQC
jgi:hypothetical protein